uniref:Putative group i salivary lipocalin n=1 Tax=Rhipicephalus pulchellus TaxID=72859 RepID=L7M9V0_RHIPC
MVGALKLAVLVVVIIVVEEGCNGSEQKNGDTANEEGAKTDEENTFETFWKRNRAARKLRSTGDIYNCEWYERGDYTKRGVILTRKMYISSTNRWTTGLEGKELYWMFRPINSISWRAGDSGTYQKRMLHHSDDYTCGVVADDYLWNADASEAEDFGDLCSESEQGHYICKESTKYELLVGKGHKDSPAEDCLQSYMDVLGGKLDTSKENVTECIDP